MLSGLSFLAFLGSLLGPGVWMVLINPINHHKGPQVNTGGPFFLFK